MRRTLVFSGPKDKDGPVRNALARAGYVPHDGDRAHDWHGLQADDGESFAAVISPSGDTLEAEKVAAAYGWRHRATRAELSEAAVRVAG